MTPESNPLAFQPQDAANMYLIVNEATVEEWLEHSTANQFFGYYYPPMSMTDFAFVGVVEDFDRSVALLEAALETRSATTRINVNPNKEFGVPYVVNYDEAQFKRDNAIDYEMYELGLERFNQLCQQHNV